MKILTRLLFVGSILSLSALGCDHKDEQARLEREAAEKTATAQRDADEAKAKAAQEVADVERKAEEARREARAEIQKDVADLDRKAVSVTERLQKAVGSAKVNATAASAEFGKRRGVLEADLQKLSTATGAAWDTVKAESKLHLDAAKDGLDSFENSISGKTSPVVKGSPTVTASPTVKGSASAKSSTGTKGE